VIGKLDQRVTISEKRQVRQANGLLEVTLIPRFTVWAEVKPKSGIQRNHAQQTENPADYEIMIRNTPETRQAKQSDILTWKNRQMNIIWIGFDKTQNLYLHIDAKDGVAI